MSRFSVKRLSEESGKVVIMRYTQVVIEGSGSHKSPRFNHVINIIPVLIQVDSVVGAIIRYALQTQLPDYTF
jgi:hypothetical protein